ncbi:threonylcarbamoyl-AMP synthase [bacterium CG_4_10_14_0_2_um_filter_33_32]|nr:MAG: threonylcarbamoyl-AMP synthase [bacterium CG_4_10_14_0_8_um_filter_33_57]PIZ85404.1 MAG: threonylcarbamoyl-AMP synthase [bacterium CG_4_10_14_0_2_um_filter_33_32]
MDIIKFSEINIGFINQELEKGKIFVISTDTSYGIVGNINKQTVERIYKIKERSKDKLMPIFVNQKIAKEVAIVNRQVDALMKEFWPGDLTLILQVGPSKNKILGSVLDPNNTIVAREPNDRLILNILKEYKLPVTATSANISNKPPAYKSKQIMDYFSKTSSLSPDYFIDSGNLPRRQVSTIIDLTSNLKILRTGRIKLKDIKEAL